MTGNNRPLVFPSNYDKWVERTKSLYQGLRQLRSDYPEALNWTDPILETLTYLIFGERPSENDWVEMALSSDVDRNHTLTRTKP